MRLAVKVGYDGTRFSGSQVQPGMRTVHGELARALAAVGAPEARIGWAGRTDAGVSAAGNVACFDAPMAPDALLPALTFAMEDVWCWAWAEVDAAFEPRVARRRRYRYHLATDLDAKRVEEALQPFLGTHDFSSFARVEPGVNPERTVFDVSARRDGAFVVIDVAGESFLWNQVRRMVEAGRRVAAGEVEGDAIERALAEPSARDFGAAAPEPLLLLDVEYSGVEFRDLRPRVLQRLDRRVAQAELQLAMLRAMRG